MATKQRGYVPVKLDKQRKFKFGMNAFCALEEKGHDLAAMERDGVKFKDIRAMVWAGLLHEFKDDPEWTEEAAGDLVDQAENMQDVFKAVSEAVALAFGQDPQKVAEKKAGN
jgi:Fe-S-cluster formation regulator IscX/YfhJ